LLGECCEGEEEKEEEDVDSITIAGVHQAIAEKENQRLPKLQLEEGRMKEALPLAKTLKVRYVFVAEHPELMITLMATTAQEERRDLLRHSIEQKVVLHSMKDEKVDQSSKSLKDEGVRLSGQRSKNPNDGWKDDVTRTGHSTVRWTDRSTVRRTSYSTEQWMESSSVTN
jgi:hypothetical protein